MKCDDVGCRDMWRDNTRKKWKKMREDMWREEFYKEYDIPETYREKKYSFEDVIFAGFVAYHKCDEGDDKSIFYNRLLSVLDKEGRREKE